MPRYNNTTTLAGGFKIGTGVPVDDRVIYSTFTDFEDMLNDLGGAAPTLYDGIEIEFMYDVFDDVTLKQTKYLWKESSYGLLTDGFEYTGAFDIIGGIDYRGRIFNLVLADPISIVVVSPTENTTVIEVPFNKVPYAAMNAGVFSVRLFEASDIEETFPNDVSVGADNIEINIFPGYVSGDIITVKIS